MKRFIYIFITIYQVLESKNNNIALKVINKNVDNFCFYIKTTYFFTKKTTKRGKNLFFYQICLVFVGFGVDFCVVLIYNKHNQ